MLLEGVTAEISGEGRPIGAAIARAFAAEGARVVRGGAAGAECAEVLVVVAAGAGAAPDLLRAARAAAPAMAARGWGAILIVAEPPAQEAVDGPARRLAAELGPRGVRVICLRSARPATGAGPPAEHLAQVADLAAVSAALVAASAATARTARA
jgi:NAD(P)-dependent dehydrogenase (short-subunit alcohol dehydrogenase family)